MKARELMTEDPICCTPDDTMESAAQHMLEGDVGSIPVVDDLQGRHIVGVVTDRDIAVRGVASAHGPDTVVRNVMSRDPHCCVADSDVEEVEQIMAEYQVRRVPVLDDEGRCIGIVAQADLARAEQAVGDDDVRRVVERISEPARQHQR